MDSKKKHLIWEFCWVSWWWVNRTKSKCWSKWRWTGSWEPKVGNETPSKLVMGSRNTCGMENVWLRILCTDGIVTVVCRSLDYIKKKKFLDFLVMGISTEVGGLSNKTNVGANDDEWILGSDEFATEFYAPVQVESWRCNGRHLRNCEKLAELSW